MTVSLTKVGNSRAIIIPSKILKRMNITDNSKLEMVIDDNAGVVSIKKAGVKADVVFPKVHVPEISESEMQSFIDSLYHIPEEDLISDERLKYILSK